MTMRIFYDYLIPAMWLAFMAYWWAMSRGVKATERRESAISRVVRLVSILGAVALLWLPSFPILGLNLRFLPPSALWFWLGAFVTAMGLSFAVWARHYLGSNWSQAVTVKEDHQLVTSGPYALVRHPIYSGLLLGFIGCAIARGELRGLVAIALVLGVLLRKLLLEEKWMAEQFGDAYATYRRHVRALLPYLI